MIRLDSITKRFGEKKVLKGISLHVEKNELLSVVGPSGCGKTTTLSIVAGICRPDEGEIYIDNILVEGGKGRHRTHVKPYKRKIGYVFQEYALFPHMRVFDNVAYGPKASGPSQQEINKKVTALLEFVGLGDYREYYPDQLSGGQKQRVALARALATNPNVLLLDEPLAALDRRTRETLRADFKKILRSLEITSIYVTHDLAEACMLSDRIAIIGNGSVQQIGKPAEILENPNSRFVAEFLGLNIYNGRVIESSSNIAKIEINGMEIIAGSSNNMNRSSVLVTLKPEDIVLSPKQTDSTQRFCRCTCNRFTGTVVEILQMKSTAKVTVDIGFPIRSELTLSSLKDLDLKEGKEVQVEFKVDSLNICPGVD